MQERRGADRHSVFGGNAEIEEVWGRGKVPNERARIINWSRGGLLLKVQSPRRRFMFAKRDPVLFNNDKLTCMIRVPPRYENIKVTADVVHVERVKKDPDHLHVGLQFAMEQTPEQIDKLARILEPRPRSGRHKRVSGRSSQVSSRIGLTVHEGGKPNSKRVKKAGSQRAKKTSKRAKRQSQRAEQQSG